MKRIGDANGSIIHPLEINIPFRLLSTHLSRCHYNESFRLTAAPRTPAGLHMLWCLTGQIALKGAKCVLMLDSSL